MKITLLFAAFTTLLVSLTTAEPIVLYCPAEGHVLNMQVACYNLPCACWGGRVHCQPSLQMDHNHAEMVYQCETTCQCMEPIQRHTPPPSYCKKTPGKKNKFSGAVDKCKQFLTKKKSKRSTFKA